ncbi:D-lactate dehydrogenase [Falsochrobactrum sp. TDYN1]|uniref:Quinone-dependent D-lactate dehydrogenase n=1 Tax=Falsochrobactrum tianjinense TaxID=2706015 RepID=A0A949UUE4_9HYPH|nr:D-lactate dehydrogenase [Falsochrobactrum sp. TDYN1]MBV2143008.1 D-lactate dehydrogenase [Falsochrobactrum sp. TDYN1]
MSQLIDELRTIAGRRHVLTGDAQTRRFRQGYRYGGGAVLAVVRPGTLVEMWRALQACHKAGTIIICQAANTGLTGGSTPVPEGYDRPVVIINTMRLRRLDLITGGGQVVSQPGVTLDQLEKTLRPIGREPHSVIGSSCIGASVTGGVCNNSGGSLIRRGPAFTQLALFAQTTASGELKLVNHLGIELGESPEEILGRLDRGEINESDIATSANRHASDHEYCNHVRDISAATPARFNADPRRLYEASGSAGRLAVFALRLDTFPADEKTQVFYIGTNDPAELENIRRDILGDFESLPIAGEYMHSSAYALSQQYGKDLFLFLQAFGTDRIPLAFALKSRFDAITEKLGLGSAISDRLLQFITGLLPEHLPLRLNDFRDKYAHHLLLKMGDTGIDEARQYLSARFPTQNGAYFECTEQEGTAAFLNRFAVGGSVVRYRAVHPKTVEDIVALDIALPRNTLDWFEKLPDEIAQKIDFTMYCGHFFCHVLHQEYLVKKGEDCDAVKDAILSLLSARGAQYPAEHNVGHLYPAADSLKDFYRELDPTNSFNPGIGKTSRLLNWQEPGHYTQ